MGACNPALDPLTHLERAAENILAYTETCCPTGTPEYAICDTCKSYHREAMRLFKLVDRTWSQKSNGTNLRKAPRATFIQNCTCDHRVRVHSPEGKCSKCPCSQIEVIM